MMRPLTDLRVAIGFLTRVPVGDVSYGGTRKVSVAAAVPWFPLVGGLVGLATAGVWRGAVEFVSPVVAASLAVTAALLITGAFHHDGLADIADAFGGGWTIEQRFEILRDSRLGTYGTAALVSALMLEVAALSVLDATGGARALIISHGLGRAAALIVMILAPVAGDGLGAAYTAGLNTTAVAGAVVATVIVAAVVSPVLIVWPALAAAVAAVATVRLAIAKIGGVTGDVLGAVTVLATVMSLVVIGAAV